MICPEEHRNAFLQNSLEILPTEKKAFQTLTNDCFCGGGMEKEHVSGLEFLSHLLGMPIVLLFL